MVFLWWFCVDRGMFQEINKETNSVTTDTWICFFLIKRYSPQAGSFSLTRVPTKGTDVHAHLILKSNCWKFKIKESFNSLSHLFVSFCPCLYISCFPAKWTIKLPHLRLICQGKCWNLLLQGTEHLRCRLISLVFLFQIQRKIKSLNWDHPATEEQK